ncbi:MAG: pyruvate, phosphate dikinase [Pseudonocardia sp.]|nr:pyruvate, phosphate dikinase [Pseudonocardia sp.]
MLIPLEQAEVETCGGKAAGLAAMLRAGLPVPGGFVVPFTAYRAAVRDLEQSGAVRNGPPATSSLRPDEVLPRPLRDAASVALARLGPGAVAVRSSATGEDSDQASAAGQYESTLAVDGLPAVARAVRDCWASLHSTRATSYRSRDRQEKSSAEDPAMAVVVQRHVDADVSGVMFTRTSPAGATTIESVWGLGPSVVAGTVTPDTYRVGADGTVVSTVADKRTRLDRTGPELRVHEVADDSRRRPTLDAVQAIQLAALGDRVAAALGGPQDIEWAVEDGRVWLLQARPITVAPPPAASPPASPPPAASPGGTSCGTVILVGTPGSNGTAVGPARVVRGAPDFDRVQPGDILVCPFTDPAWTPLLGLVAGVVTETGGVLSHAAIVAREHGIPAVLGVPAATTTIPDGATVTVDATAGTVSTG